MAKDKTLAELLEEAKKLQEEIDAKKEARVKELRDEAKQLGYRLVEIGADDKPKKATAGGTTKELRAEMETWLRANLKAPMEKEALQKLFRMKFEGKRLRVDGWPDVLKEDAKGNISLR